MFIHRCFESSGEGGFQGQTRECWQEVAAQLAPELKPGERSTEPGSAASTDIMTGAKRSKDVDGGS